MRDTQVQPLAVDLISPQEGDEESEFIELAVIVGLALPFPDPQNPNQPILVPSERIRIPIGRDFGLRLAESIKNACEKLPEEKPPSPIQVATSLAGVDKAAEVERKLRAQS